MWTKRRILSLGNYFEAQYNTDYDCYIHESCRKKLCKSAKEKNRTPSITIMIIKIRTSTLINFVFIPCSFKQAFQLSGAKIIE